MNNIVRFLQEVKLELTRVIWPSFDEWIGSTIIVLVLIAIFTVYFGVIDFGLSRLASYVFEGYGQF